MTDLASSGISVALPAGWDGRISIRNDGRAAALHAESGTFVMNARSQPVVHLANFALPEERGDFGSGAVELMGPHDVFVVLFEYGPEAVTTALFGSDTVPWPLASAVFDPSTLRRGILGQAGFQAFFQQSGRVFCLYVVLGASTNRAVLVPLVNSVLATFRIEPR